MSIRSVSTFTAGALLASALTFTGMQSWQAGAAPGDDDTTFVPAPPCRLFDTRSGPNNVGDRSAALGPDETFTAQVTGSNGSCIGIPNNATAVAFNMTIVGPTASSFLTLFPADLTDPPVASNLNWTAGQASTPNKVDVKLSPDGKVKLFNKFGDVDVIADVVGWYTPSSLTELQTSVTDLETRLVAAEASIAGVPNLIREAQPATLRYEGSTSVPITDQWTSVVSSAPIFLTRTGKVLVFASGTGVQFNSGADVQCVITDRTTGFATNNNMRWEAAGDSGQEADEGDAGNLAGMESFDVTPGSGTYRLMCRTLDDTDGASVWAPQLTIVFIADR